MIRFAVLVVLLTPASVFAQTADVLIEISALLDSLRLQKGPISTVTYDLTKVVKGKGGLNTSDKVLQELADMGFFTRRTTRSRCCRRTASPSAQPKRPTPRSGTT